MPFDIDSARENIQKWEVTIKKWEGITHALLRVADPMNANKNIKELEKIFTSLDKENKKMLQALAEEIAGNAPFSWRRKKTALLGDTLMIRTQSNLPSESTPIQENPLPEAPVSLWDKLIIEERTWISEKKIYLDGGVYTWQLLDGMRDGVGSFIDTEGNAYSWEWKDDMRNGGGQLRFSDGSYYEWTFLDDDFDTWSFYAVDGTIDSVWKDGKQVIEGDVPDEAATQEPLEEEAEIIPVQYPEGEYRWDYESDLRNGHGIMNFLNGDYYEWEWKDDMRDGKGLYIRNGGNIFTWIFKENQPYTGEVTDSNQRVISTYTDGKETVIIPQDEPQTHANDTLEKKATVVVKKHKNNKQNKSPEKPLASKPTLPAALPDTKSDKKNPITLDTTETPKNPATKTDEYSPLSGVPNPKPSSPISEEAVTNEFRKPNIFEKFLEKWFPKDSKK